MLHEVKDLVDTVPDRVKEQNRQATLWYISILMNTLKIQSMLITQSRLSPFRRPEPKLHHIRHGKNSEI
jgi:hypothetical protein